MEIKEFFKNFSAGTVKLTKYGIEIFDDHGNNLLWMNHDGRFYSKSFIKTDVGYKETSVSGMKRDSKGDLVHFERHTHYDKTTGAITYEWSSDGRINSNNVYRSKIGMETEKYVDRYVPPTSKNLF